MSNTSQFSLNLSKENSIEYLPLTKRTANALKRSGIKTVGEIVELVESGMIESIRGLGVTCILEIMDCLDHQLKDEEKLKLDVAGEDTLKIGLLELSRRSFNSLQNAGVQTVVELVRLVESGEIHNIRGLGGKCISEIQDRLTRIDIKGSRDVAENSDVDTSLLDVDMISVQAIKSKSQLVSKQLSIGSLHEQAIVANRSIKEWFTQFETTENNVVYETLTIILSSSHTICEEIEFLINSISTQQHKTILLSRFGYNKRSLGQIGKEIGVTRERIRQLENDLKTNMSNIVQAIVGVESIKNFKTIPTLLRIQSSLLIAKDIGLDINYQQWTHHIQSSGLAGNWKSVDFAGIDPFEMMIAICRVIENCKIPCLQIPKCLQYAIELANSGMASAPAKNLHFCETLSLESIKLINRHQRHSGGVFALWLSKQIDRNLEETKSILHGLGYKMLSKDWFVPMKLQDPHLISKNEVFHQGLRKLFQYCGPLPIDDVCAGIRYVISRTNLPIPPPDVMAEIVRYHGYKYDKDLYYWDGDFDASLSNSAAIIMRCIEEFGPVVHRSKLVDAFLNNDLSLHTLSASLRNSPLFEKVEQSLYKVRGRAISSEDITRAKVSAD